jgi:MraZ protein
MQGLSARLDRFDLFSPEQDDLATAVFADSIQLPFDGDGRIVLPEPLIAFAGMDGQAAFVGMGAKFQVWCPRKLERRRDEARASVKSGKLTIPQGGGAA